MVLKVFQCLLKQKSYKPNKIFLDLLSTNWAFEPLCGESKRRLKDRFAEHQGYVRDKDLTKATGQHFNTRGHSIYDMQITILEHVKNADEVFRKIREKMHINLFNTKDRGMNKVS